MRRLFVLFLFLGVFVQAPQASAAGGVNFTYSGPGNFSPSQLLSGTVTLKHSEFIPGNASLNAHIDSSLVSTLLLGDYIGEEGEYAFKAMPFSYNLTAEGVNTYREYPDQSFSYTIKATGTCGGDQCCDEQGCWCECQGEGGEPLCTEPYPCEWSIDFSGSGTVDGKEGLKFIYDGTDSISQPTDSNYDTVWTETGNANPEVETSMRAWCGLGTDYTFQDGWVQLLIEHVSLDPVPGTSHRKTNIGPFDHESLNPGYRKYGGPEGVPSGGLYKDEIYQSSPDQVEWNGTSGDITIKNYDSTSTYIVRYLPPNGPRLCAYTGYAEEHSDEWTSYYSLEDLETSYDNPYTRTFTEYELNSFLPAPDCPGGVSVCNQTTYSYGAVETFDPFDQVDVDFDTKTYTVTATTDSQELAIYYSESISLEDFPNLLAPVEIGPHNLTLRVRYQGEVLGEGSIPFDTCQDLDGDGWCLETGDCNDDNRFINPGAPERCNEEDDDCDGLVDEDFWQAGTKLGSPCGVGICTGIWVCSEDESDVVCSSRYNPGDRPEICNDGLDNDCDGVTDESIELVEGEQVPACTCKNGDTKSCGSNVGYCRSGVKVCINNVWGECKDARGPRTETCNQVDDDCDGITDNVEGKSSVETTKCGCYGGSLPTKEICNDIDDDCDGKVDEGIACCTTGQTRPCGSNVGICQQGTQSCVNGEWGKCVGGTKPQKEICYDELDNDCDGKVDEKCLLEVTCNNDVQDLNEEGVDCGGDCPQGCGPGDVPFPWMYLSFIGIALIIIVGVLAITGKV